MAAKKSRFADQATLESIVRFGPELSVLKQAQRQAEDTYGRTVHQARAGARAVQESVGQSLPAVTSAYDQAIGNAGQFNTLLGRDLAGLGSVADSIKAGASLEARTQLGNLSTARAGAVRDLQGRRTQAAAGQVASTRAASSQLVSDLTKILQQRKDLAGQSGAFKAATIGDLQEAARGRALRVRIADKQTGQSERNSLRSAGIDPNTGKPIPNGKLDPKSQSKSHVATGEQHGAARDAISQARTWIQRLTRSQHMKPRDILESLTTGDTLTDSGGNKLKLPSIPADYVQAAWELQNTGGLSQKTVRALHARHLSVKQLGIPSFGSKRGASQAAVQHPVDVVQQLLAQLGG